MSWTRLCQLTFIVFVEVRQRHQDGDHSTTKYVDKKITGEQYANQPELHSRSVETVPSGDMNFCWKAYHWSVSMYWANDFGSDYSCYLSWNSH